MGNEKPVVLVVDDEPALVEVAAQHLILEGYDIIKAYDGQAGLRAVFDERPDVVVLDVMMPIMGGFETCRRIPDLLPLYLRAPR